MKVLYYLCFFFFLCSCTPEPEKNTVEQVGAIVSTTAAKDTTLAKGIVHPKIFCNKESSQSYALYLPNAYSPQKNFPVIYFFDSHGEGLLPVEKYRALAEKYGYIIAGSNNSQNGLSWENTQQIVRNFFDDVPKKFAIDNLRVYTSGFSGGARVASSIALLNGGIAGVAACGAGFPNSGEPLNKKFVFVAIAGNEDFNLIELKNLDRALENSSVEHHLIVFDGKHEWCPAEIMEEAFQNFEISAMKNNLTGGNDSLLNGYMKKKEKQIKQYKNKKQIVEMWNTYRQLAVHLHAITDVSKYKSEMVAMENSPELISSLKKEIDSEGEELKKQKEYSGAFATQNLNWWRNEIIVLQRKNNLESKRMLGYLGLSAYMYSSGALNKNLLQQAEHFLKIYQLLEPKNPEHRYLYAQMFMKINQPEKALAQLKTAYEFGFRDTKRLKEEELFASLRNKKAFIDLTLR